jgi:hypothetical protein
MEVKFLSDSEISMPVHLHLYIQAQNNLAQDNLRMLLNLNGGVCEVVTGLVIGGIFFYPGLVEYLTSKNFLQFTLSFKAPGYTIKFVSCLAHLS